MKPPMTRMNYLPLLLLAPLLWARSAAAAPVSPPSGHRARRAPISAPGSVRARVQGNDFLTGAVQAELAGDPDAIVALAEKQLKVAPGAPAVAAFFPLLDRHYRSVSGGSARYRAYAEAVSANPASDDEARLLAAFARHDLLPEGERWRRAAQILGGPQQWAVSPVRGDFAVDAYLSASLPTCAAQGAAECGKTEGWRTLDFSGGPASYYKPAFRQGGVAWAVANFANTQARLLALRAGTSTVFVDGKNAAELANFTRFDGTHAFARIEPGQHVLAVKFLVEEPDTDFSIAILAPGAAVTRLARVSPLAQALRAEALGRKDQAMEIISQRLNAPGPQAAAGGEARALRWRLAALYRANPMELLPGKIAEERERAILDALASGRPSARVHFRFADLAERNEDQAEAAKQFLAGLALAPDNADLRLTYADYLERRGYASEAHEQRRRAEKNIAGRLSSTARLYEYARAHNEIARESRLAEALEKLNPEDDSLLARRRLRDPAGLFAQRLREFFGHPDPLHTVAGYLAGLEADAGHPAKALAWLQAAWKNEAGGHFVGGARVQAAQYLAQLDRKDEALALLREAAAESATATEARAALEAAGESEPVMKWRLSDVERRKAAARPTASAEQPAEFLLDWTADYYYPDLTRRSIYHSMTRVLNAQGVEREAQVQLPGGARLLRLQVIKADGRVLEPGEPEGGKYLMPDLEVGDIIEQEYLEGGGVGDGTGTLKAGAADNRRIFLFNSTATRTRRSEQYLIGPGMARCQVMTGNSLPEITDAAPGRHFMTDDPERILREPNSPPDRAYIPWAGVNCGNRDGDTLAFWSGAFSWRTRASSDLRALAASLAKSGGANRIADDEKIDRLFAFVQHEIKGEWKQNLADPSFVLANREGNRLLVARAVLQLWNIPHEYWLAANPDEYELTREMPAPGQFGSPQFIKLRWHGKEQFITLGSEFGPPDLIPADSAGAKAVVIAPDGRARFDTLPDFPPLANVLNETRRFAADGAAEVDGVMTFSPYTSAQLRSQLANLPAEKRGPVFEKVAQSIVPGLDLNEVKMTGIESGGDAVHLVYRGALRGASPASRGLRLPQPAGESGIAELADRPDRKLPLWLAPAREIEQIRVTLIPPPGFHFETDDPLLLDLPGIKYRLEYRKLENGAVRYERDLDRPRLRLAPAAYTDWSREIRKTRLAEQARPLLVAGAGADRSPSE